MMQLGTHKFRYITNAKATIISFVWKLVESHHEVDLPVITFNPYEWLI